MGLEDRDYMHERNAEVFEKRNSTQNHPFRSTLWMVLTWTTMLFLLYQSFLWLESYKQARNELISSSKIETPEKKAATSQRKNVPSTTEGSQQNAPAGSALPVPDTRNTVTKCLLNGQVTFTDGKCPNGSTTSYVTVSTGNVVNVLPPTFIPTTPKIQPQVVMQQPAAETNNVASMKETECGFLNHQVDQLDALARQPLSSQSQDSISEQRKKYRSRQFALHC